MARMLFVLLLGCRPDPNEGPHVLNEGGTADSDGDGFETPADCDDADAGVNPAAAERCNGIDDDCDGAVDDQAIDASTWYADVDGDGYGDIGAPTRSCSQPKGAVKDATDCDDTYADVNPGHVEVCGDGRDNDCSGTVNHCGLATSLQLETDADVLLTTDDLPDPRFIGFMGSPGDVTGDGIDDYAFEFPYVDVPTVESSLLYVRPGPLTDSGPVEAGATVISGLQLANAGLGRVAPPTDVNGDGYDDLWFGCGALRAAGAVFFGPLESADADVLSADVWFEPDEDDILNPSSMSAASGDLNGDGNVDLLYGRLGVSSALSAGEIWVTLGPVSAGAHEHYDFRWVGTEPTQDVGFGLSLAVAGDIDGDGLDDVVAGAMLDDRVGPYGGAAFVILGPGTAVSTIDDADWTLLPPAWAADAPLGLGMSLSEAGDLDQDGLMDLQVGSAGSFAYVLGETPRASIYVLHGRAEALDAATISDVADATFEASGEGGLDIVGPSGDFDGDGFLDLLATGQFFEGRTGTSFLFLGPVSGVQTTDDARASFRQESSRGLGFSSLGSDVNGDGLADAIFSPTSPSAVAIVYGGLAP